MPCQFCKTETENPKFCSRSCAAKYNNTAFPKRIQQPSICKICNCSFKGHAGKVYCSKVCKEKASDVMFSNRINETGCYYTPENNAGSKSIRKYLIRKYGNQCMLCNQSGHDWNDKPLTLIVDLINGHADDWSVNNIRIICPNCDSQLPTYKGGNKGNSTRKYYITQK